MAYEGSQLKDESLQAYMTQLAENPGYGMAHYGFCVALFAKGMVDMAVTECENALKLDPEICLSHFQLGRHYEKVLDSQKSIEHCRAFVACDTQERYPAELNTCKETVRTLEVE